MPVNHEALYTCTRNEHFVELHVMSYVSQLLEIVTDGATLGSYLGLKQQSATYIHSSKL